MMSRFWVSTLLVLQVGCFRGTPTDNPPIHPILNMDDQEKFEPYERNTLFEDESAMRMPIAGTVGRGDYHEENADFYSGVSASGQLLAKNPVPLTSLVMERGRERYGIYCTPCHGAIGNGKGIVAQRGLTSGFVPPTDFHTDDMRKKPDGHYFQVITKGIRNMQPYQYQIKPEDRWAIVHYVRALQRSQRASVNDVPVAVREKIKP